MKKLFGILLILIYSFSVSGFSLQLNYCCNKITLKCCKPAEKKNCCSSKKEKKCICVIKEITQAEFESKSILISNQMVSTTPVNGFREVSYSYLQPDVFYAEEADVSPPISGSPLYLLYSVFRL